MQVVHQPTNLHSLLQSSFNNAYNAGDVLSFGANPLTLNSGTIVDRAEGGNATITSAVSIGTAGVQLQWFLHNRKLL